MYDNTYQSPGANKAVTRPHQTITMTAMWDDIKRILDTYQPSDEIESRKATALEGAQSAVIVPLFMVAEEIGILIIGRSDHVKLHRGQMGFPGGMMEDKDDGDLLRTAARETDEEVGIFSDQINILGKLKTRKTYTTGIVVTPFVGSIPFPYTFSPDPMEVKSMHTASLVQLLNTVQGKDNQFDLPPPVYTIDERPVWGLTASILAELAQVLEPVLKTDSFPE